MANTDTDIPSKIEDFSSFASEHTYRASNGGRELDSRELLPTFGQVSNSSLNISKEAITEIPVSIFNQGLSGLEALAFYLKEHHGLRYCAIASMLNRDDRTIWDSYTQGKKKSALFSPSSDSIFIPLSIFKDRSFGVLEAISKHLKEKHSLKFSQIAQLLGKNDRTIWTAYNRAKKKEAGVHHAG